MKRLAVFSLLMLLTASVPARAALIELDLFASGDQLITAETDTGLEGLDLTKPVGLADTQVLASAFVGAQGFRYATDQELDGLYTLAGGAPTQPPTFLAVN